MKALTPDKKKAIQIIMLFGLISLFGDIVYEGARSVNGPFLKTLGANAAMVGLIAGLGEFAGYAIRLASGYFSDRTKAYWLFTFVGYGMLISVPLMAMAGIWQIAAVLIIMERLGKALRSPAKDTIVSQVTKHVGTGFGFGLQESMDQIGAIAGPLMFAGLFSFLKARDASIHEYQSGYSYLWAPFILVMLCLAVAFFKVPDPEAMEERASNVRRSDKLSRAFWLYNLFTFIATLGFVNFLLIAYHFKAKNIMSDAQIPFFYAIAMAVDGVAAFIIGKTYDVFKERSNNDRGGLVTLFTIPFLSIFIPITVFSSSLYLAVGGVIIWGIVMGIHETIMKSAIADITPLKKRGTGYGIFNSAYGVAMFIGSAVMGLIYDFSIPLVIILSVIIEAVSVFVLILLRKEILLEA